MATTTKTIKNITNVFDLTIQLYGNLSYTFQLINDNPTYLDSVQDYVSVSDVITYDTIINNTSTPVNQIVPLPIFQKQIRVREQQNMFDLALQLYGDVSYVFKLIQDNPVFDNIGNSGLVGQVARYDEQNLSLTTYYKLNQIFINTGVLQDRQFDDSFSLSFL